MNNQILTQGIMQVTVVICVSLISIIVAIGWWIAGGDIWFGTLTRDQRVTVWLVACAGVVLVAVGIAGALGGVL